jgi:hypothetical protein
MMLIRHARQRIRGRFRRCFLSPLARDLPVCPPCAKRTRHGPDAEPCRPSFSEGGKELSRRETICRWKCCPARGAVVVDQAIRSASSVRSDLPICLYLHDRPPYGDASARTIARPDVGMRLQGELFRSRVSFVHAIRLHGTGSQSAACTRVACRSDHSRCMRRLPRVPGIRWGSWRSRGHCSDHHNGERLRLHRRARRTGTQAKILLELFPEAHQLSSSREASFRARCAFRRP